MGIISQIGGFLSNPVGTLLGNVGQGVINAAQNRSNIDRQNKNNMELAKYTYSKDLEMWNKGNEYNAPQAQMARLKAAKLNPNLVYGSGAVAGQSAQQLPKFSAPQQEFNYQPPVDIPKTLGETQDFKIQQAQLDNLKAQRNAIVQDTLIKTAEANARPELLKNKIFGTGMDNYWKNFLNQGKELKQRYEIQNLERYSGDYLSTRNRLAKGMLDKQIAEIANLTASSELKNLQKDMYMPQFWAKTLTGGYNAVKSLFKPGSTAKGIKFKTPGATSRTSPAWRQPGVGKRIRYVK